MWSSAFRSTGRGFRDAGKRANRFGPNRFARRQRTTIATDMPVQPSSVNPIRLVFRGIGYTLAASAAAGSVYTAYKLHKQYQSWENVLDAGQRFFRTMRAGALITWDYKWNLYGLDEDSEEYKTTISQIHLRTAQSMRDVCLQSGGLYIKVGQYLAAQNHVSPREYTETLKVLQDRAPHKLWPEIEQVFLEDLGADPSKFFKEFDKTPIAAASIAQVHRAVTHDGREVAVKMQYPEVRRRFGVDMFTYDLVLELLAKFFPSLDVRWMSTEMRSVLEQELDFMNEARNAERAFKNFKGNPTYYIPKIQWDLTAGRVMTAEFIHGVKVTDVKGFEKMGFTTREVAQKTISCLAEQVFVHGFLHADPHPGNIFIRPNPLGKQYGAQVVLLDHGLYKQLSDPTRILFARLYKALVLNQRDEARKVCLEMGINNWKMFAMAVLMRPLDPDDIFGPEVSRTQRLDMLRNREKLVVYMQHNFSKRREEMMSMMQAMPIELLLVFRNNNLIRSINHELGVPVNRFTLFARYSMKGLAASGAETLAGWRDRIHFEWKLFSMDFRYWAEGVLLRIGKSVGLIPSDITQEGTKRDSDMMRVEEIPLDDGFSELTKSM